MKKPMLILILLISGFIFIHCVQAKAGTIRHNDPSFEIFIPDYFTPFNLSQMPQGWDAGYYEKTGFEDKQPITIGIEIKHKPLPMDYSVDLINIRKDYSQGTIIEKTIFESLGFKLEGLRIIVPSGSMDGVIYKAEIPVKPRAIEITVGGIIDREKEIRKIIDDMLYSLKAESSWGNKTVF